LEPTSGSWLANNNLTLTVGVAVPTLLMFLNWWFGWICARLIGCAPAEPRCKIFGRLYAHRLVVLSMVVGCIQVIQLGLRVGLLSELYLTPAAQHLLIVVFYSIILVTAYSLIDWMLPKSATSVTRPVALVAAVVNVSSIFILLLGIRSFLNVLEIAK
jgi:hypothetical protein